MGSAVGGAPSARALMAHGPQGEPCTTPCAAGARATMWPAAGGGCFVRLLWLFYFLLLSPNSIDFLVNTPRFDFVRPSLSLSLLHSLAP